MSSLTDHKHVIRMAALALLLCATGAAQQMGQIVGVVQDPTGAVVPGATVTAIEAGTGLTRSAVSDSEGRYILPSLRPTSYQITAEVASFKTFSQTGVELLANQSATINITMVLGEVTETVTVKAAATQVDTATSTIKEVVDRDRIEELPLNGRNAAQLTTLVPGTVWRPLGGWTRAGPRPHPGRW